MIKTKNINKILTKHLGKNCWIRKVSDGVIPRSHHLLPPGVIDSKSIVVVVVAHNDIVVINLGSSLILECEKDITFEMLEKLSILFGTKDINIGSLTMQDQYYPVNDPDVISIIEINNISCWPELNDNNSSNEKNHE